MNRRNFFASIQIANDSATPKYLQLSEQIITAVRNRELEAGATMPSINEMSDDTELARPTVQKAYKYLQRIRVLESVPGKCYFITGHHPKSELRIALYFNKLSTHKKIIYDAFVQEMGEDVAIDFFVYNNEYSTFRNLLEQNSRDYTHFVIIPHFLDRAAEAVKLINNIPAHKLVLLDKKLPGIHGEFGAVYEDFEQDIYTALAGAGELISKKYSRVRIVFPADSYFPQEILQGYRLFCKKYGFKTDIITSLSSVPILKGDLFITLIETDLVQLVETAVTRKLRIGKDVGIISYNETPIKKIIRNGIATISTDFLEMGRAAARLILSSSKEHIQVPFSLTRRASL